MAWVKAHWTILAGSLAAGLTYWTSHGGTGVMVGGVSLVGLIAAALYSEVPK